MIDATTAGYALLLGMVAAFNPCGFAILPAYIAVLATGTAESRLPRVLALRRATTFALAMSLGFLMVFVSFGLLFVAVNASLQGVVLPAMSFVTLALGLLVVWLGVVVIVRGELRGPGMRFAGSAPRTSFWSQLLYGATFALASMSCTIGLFLAIVAQAFAAPNPVAAGAPFVLYAIGMGSSIMIVSLVAAVAGMGLAAGLRRHTPTLMRIGGVVMVIAGLYVVVFALAEILPRFGIHALNELLLWTGQLQGAVSGAIQSWGMPLLVAVVVIAAAAMTVVLWRSRRTTPMD